MKVILILMLLVMITPVMAYDPPIGIPDPGWGIETTNTMFSGETYNFVGDGGVKTYPESSWGGPYTHYIAPNVVGATDTDNPYGTEATPRATLPTFVYEVPAGSVIQIVGPYTLPARGIFTWDGTAADPVFFMGKEGFEPTRVDGNYVFDCNYAVFDNIKFEVDNGDNTNQTLAIGISGHTISHIAIRNCEFWGGTETASGVGHLAIAIRNDCDTAGHNGTMTNIVVYNNYFHNLSDERTDTDGGDMVGVSVDAYASDVWILENTFHHIGGDGIQVAHDYKYSTEAAIPSNIYIGKNTFHDIFENAVDLKKCEDVIISQNIGYDLGTTSDNDMASTVSRAFRSDQGSSQAGNQAWGRERIWMLYNIMYNCATEDGVFQQANDRNKTEPIATEQYYIGNVIYNCNLPSGGAAGFKIADLTKGGLINNTTYNVDYPFYWRVSDVNDVGEEIVIYNNLFVDCSETYGGYGDITNLAAGDTTCDYSTVMNMGYNTFYDPDGANHIHWRIIAGAAQVQAGYSIADFKTDPNLSGFAGNTEDEDPLFTSTAGLDFTLQSGSPSIGDALATGIVETIYARFETLYSIDLRDITNENKNRYKPWDLGAIEYRNAAGMGGF